MALNLFKCRVDHYLSYEILSTPFLISYAHARTSFGNALLLSDSLACIVLTVVTTLREHRSRMKRNHTAD